MTVSCLFAKSLVQTRAAACRRLAVAVASRQVRRRGFHTSLAVTQAATLVVPETDNKHHRVFSTAHVQEQEVQDAQIIVSKEDEHFEETKRRRLSEVRQK